MDIALWVLQGLLALVMLMAGGMKLAKGSQLAQDPKMAWTEDFSDTTIRTIGALEVAAAVGLILPWALDIAPVLTPLAAVGVVAVMAGAVITHRRRHEPFVMNLVIALVAAVVAVGRFATS